MYPEKFQKFIHSILSQQKAEWWLENIPYKKPPVWWKRLRNSFFTKLFAYLPFVGFLYVSIFNDPGGVENFSLVILWLLLIVGFFLNLILALTGLVLHITEKEPELRSVLNLFGNYTYAKNVLKFPYVNFVLCLAEVYLLSHMGYVVSTISWASFMLYTYAVRYLMSTGFYSAIDRATKIKTE